MADDIYVTVTEEASTTVTTVGEQGLTGSTGLITDIVDVSQLSLLSDQVVFSFERWNLDHCIIINNY